MKIMKNMEVQKNLSKSNNKIDLLFLLFYIINVIDICVNECD